MNTNELSGAALLWRPPERPRSARAPRFCRTERQHHEYPRKRFADLFAGIGGFHLALDLASAFCTFAAENNPYACRTYESNFAASDPELFNKGWFAPAMQGFPSDFTFPVSTSQGMKQLRSIMAASAVKSTAWAIPKALQSEKASPDNHRVTSIPARLTPSRPAPSLRFTQRNPL